MGMSDILTLVLIVLAAAGVWLLVEAVVTVRRVRPLVSSVKKTVDDAAPVIENVNELVEQAKPIVARLGSVVEDAAPAAVQITPVLERTSSAIGALTSDLEKLDVILGDVSKISRTAGDATSAVGDAAGTLALKARSLLGRGRSAQQRHAIPAPGAVCAPVAESATPEVRDVLAAEAQPRDEASGYFTYPGEHRPGQPDGEHGDGAPDEAADGAKND